LENPVIRFERAPNCFRICGEPPLVAYVSERID
jgi:hypothetical protein